MSAKFKPLKPGDMPIHESDEGALAVRIGVHPEHDEVVIDFGKPVAWFSFGPEEIEPFIARLREKVDEIEARRARAN